MEIKGKVHCFFEQSGTFKNEFIKLGIPAEDYDIQNNFGQTDHVVDLFENIQNAYEGGGSVFDNVTKDDLIIAFFPCIYFCDNNTMYFEGTSKTFIKLYRENKNDEVIKELVDRSEKRQFFYKKLLQLVYITFHNNIRLIIENPYGVNRIAYLARNFFKPTIIDNDRSMRGDKFKKPTGYWFFNCENETGFTCQIYPKAPIIIDSYTHSPTSGICNMERSVMTPNYARNFICDFILGKKQNIGQLSLF